MGLSNSNSERKTFVNILNGKLTVKCDKDAINAVSRKNKKEQEVWEQYHDKLSGFIEDMKIVATDFGKVLEINLRDAADLYTLNIPVESKYFDSFCAKIGNANLANEITIAPFSFQPKDKEHKQIGISLYQNGVKLDYYFSSEEPKGKPFPQGKLDEEDWKVYKIQERKFYQKFIEILMQPKPTETSRQEPQPQGDDLPF